MPDSLSDIHRPTPTAAPPLRVLCVIGSLHGFGAERQLVEFLKHLDRRHFAPQLYLARKEGDLLAQVPADVPIHAFIDPTETSATQCFRRWMKPARIFRRWHLRQIVQRERIDLVLDRTYLATLDTAAALRGLNVPRISCAVAAPELGLEMYPGFSKRHTFHTAKRAYQSATLVVTNAEGLRNRMIELFDLAPERVVTQYNLVDLARIERDSQQELDWPWADRFTLVTAGRLSAEKGHADLIEAFATVVREHRQPAALLILGSGPLEGSLRQLIAEHQLEQHVHLPGYTANPWPYFRRSQLFVLPSHSDAMPNALLEAIACRVPTIATDCPFGPREILDGGRVGTLAPPGDIPDLADAIRAAMNQSASQREQQIEAAYERLEELFALQTGMRRWDDLLRSLMPGS